MHRHSMPSTSQTKSLLEYWIPSLLGCNLEVGKELVAWKGRHLECVPREQKIWLPISQWRKKADNLIPVHKCSCTVQSWRSCSTSPGRGNKINSMFQKDVGILISNKEKSHFSIFTCLAIIRTREKYKAGYLPGEAGLLQVEKGI